MSTLSGLVYRSRQNLGLSQKDFGKLINVHEQTVSKWERGINLTVNDWQASIMVNLQYSICHDEAKAKIKHYLDEGLIANALYLAIHRSLKFYE